MLEELERLTEGLVEQARASHDPALGLSVRMNEARRAQVRRQGGPACGGGSARRLGARGRQALQFPPAKHLETSHASSLPAPCPTPACCRLRWHAA